MSKENPELGEVFALRPSVTNDRLNHPLDASRLVVVTHQPEGAHVGAVNVDYADATEPHNRFSVDTFELLETVLEDFTVTEPWNLKPGDVVTEAPHGPHYDAAVHVTRRVVKPLPPIVPGSFIIANGTGYSAGVPLVELFLTTSGEWVTKYGSGSTLGWTVPVIQERGFTVIRDAGEES